MVANLPAGRGSTSYADASMTSEIVRHTGGAADQLVLAQSSRPVGRMTLEERRAFAKKIAAAMVKAFGSAGPPPG